MEYSIKEIAQSIDITEQGLYKRIKTNYAEYIKYGIIVTKEVEQPNGKKEQVFLTKKGVEELLKTKQFRSGATLQGFNNDMAEVEQPLNQVEQPSTIPTKPTDTIQEDKSINDKVYEVLNQQLNQLNQQIADLKEDKKQLNERLDKQEQNFNERLDRQEQFYKNLIETINNNFRATLLQLQAPIENTQREHNETIINIASDTNEVKAQEEITENTTNYIVEEKRRFKRIF